MPTLKPNSRTRFISFREETWLIPTLGAALLLLGLVVTEAQAAPPSQSPTPVPSGGPLQSPSAVRGEMVWIESCAPCHGMGGRGDGPTASAPQMAENPPTDFTDQSAARQRTLADMFLVTKEGRMDRLMPPWGGQLSDDQIWDVVAYAQTFATSPDDIAAGEAIYEANCAECHAADGTGAVPGAPDFADAAAMAVKTPQFLFDVTSQGQGDMPAFSEQGGGARALSEEERWQVVDYALSLSYEPISLEGSIFGQVQNATTGQAVDDVEVKLRRWQEESELAPLVVQADADGVFRFGGLDTRSHAFYRAEVDYGGVSFPGEFVSFEPGVTQLSLPLNVYETTGSDENINVERFHFILFGDQPGALSVLELYQFSNQGDRAYVGTVNEAGLRETVRIGLPAEAQGLILQSGTMGVDFLETEGGLVATSPIVPGVDTFEAAFIYVVPYSGATLDLDHPIYYDTASVNGLLLDVGAKLESDALTFGGERTAQGQTYLQYTAQNLEMGETLPIRLDDLDKIEFAGTPEPVNNPAVIPSTGLKQTVLLWMMLGLGAAAFVFVLAYPVLRPRLAGEALASEGDLKRDYQRLLLTLARLDQAYEAGDLNETVYRRARARRKAELTDVVRRLQEPEL